MVELPAQREAVAWIRSRWAEVSERRAVKLVGLPRSTWRYQKKNAGEATRKLVREAALAHPRFGHRRITQTLQKQLKRPVSRRHVQRIMQAEKLQVRTRRRQKWVARPAPPSTATQRPDERWAMDFVSEWCIGVRRSLRIFVAVDCCTRELLACEGRYSMPARCVVAILERLRLAGRKPAQIRCDNGPEFVSHQFVAWCKIHGVELSYIQPGKPTQNAHAESCNGRLRDECLNGHYFLDAADAQPKLDAYRLYYLHERPHGGLNGKTPIEAARAFGVTTPFAPTTLGKAKPSRRQGNPAGELRSALTAARLGLKSQLSRRRA